MYSCPSDYMALNIVRVRIFWTSNIFVIIVFPYTYDTGAVTDTEPGVECYKLPLIEINIAAFQLFNTLFRSQSLFINVCVCWGGGGRWAIFL